MRSLEPFMVVLLVNFYLVDVADICILVNKYSNFKSNFEVYLSHKDTICKTHFHHDCMKILKTFPSVKDDVYIINPGDGGRHFPAFCDMNTDGGGWMVIQRRMNGSESFNRSWFEYEKGFGNLTSDFWLGNAPIHRITSEGNWELRIDLVQKNGRTGYAKYVSFCVGDKPSFYKLNVKGYSGNIGDSLSYSNGMGFSAPDFDLDNSSASCAQLSKGGWWFSDCAQSTLNGYYDSAAHTSSILWKTWTSMAVTSSIMMIRPHFIQVCSNKVNEEYWCLGKVDGDDCSDILKKNALAPDGIYTIDPGDGQGPFRVYCDMTTDGGGWVVFQRRIDGSEDFYRTSVEYKNGFGLLSNEFYLGNDRIHRLTSKDNPILRVDLEDFNHTMAFAMYKIFHVGNAESNYKLSIGNYSGTAGDSLAAQINMGFTTKDKDVDTFNGNCAQIYHGAWWYSSCHKSNLNGEYNNTNHAQGINWFFWRGFEYSLYRSEMKLRPQSSSA